MDARAAFSSLKLSMRTLALMLRTILPPAIMREILMMQVCHTSSSIVEAYPRKGSLYVGMPTPLLQDP